MKNKVKRICIVVCVLLFMFPFSFYAQDLIITNGGDSLNCKIIKVKNDEVSFAYKHLGKIMNTKLRLDEISVCQFKYFETPEVPVDEFLKKRVYPRIRIAVQGGYAYRTAELSSNLTDYPFYITGLTDYMNKLKHGFNYGVDFSYYFNKYFGIGVGYNAFQAKNKMQVDIKDMPGGITIFYGEMSDNIRIDFVGAFFNSRILHAKNKNALLFGLGVGYIAYQDKGYALNYTGTIKGGNVGFCGNIGYDISITKNLAVGLQCSYIFGRLTQGKVKYSYPYPYETSITNENENLSRIDISAGLRVNIW